MSSNSDQRCRSAQETRALLAVFNIQPPPDFTIQVLARVYARQATHPLPSQQLSRAEQRAVWPVWRRSWVPIQGVVAYSLLLMSAALLWGVSIWTLPVASPEEARHADAALQTSTVPDASLQEVIAAAEPALLPLTLATTCREAQEDEADRARGESYATRPKAQMAPRLPGWVGAETRPTIQTQAQRSRRQSGTREKHQRSRKSLRLSMYVSASTHVG